jgi:hypothetical protein
VTRIVRRSRNAVDARLATARREMKLFFDDPAALRRMTANVSSSDAVRSDSGQDLIQLLRKEIFASPMGHCFTADDLDFVYRISKKPPGHKFVGHVVSCEACLKRVQKLLRITDKGERHPLDSIRDGLLGTVLFLAPTLFGAICSFLLVFVVATFFIAGSVFERFA